MKSYSDAVATLNNPSERLSSIILLSDQHDLHNLVHKLSGESSPNTKESQNAPAKSINVLCRAATAAPR